MPFPIKVNIRISKEEIELDPKVFPICETRREAIPRFLLPSKKIYFIHRLQDGSFNVIELSNDELKRYLFR